MVDSPVHHPAFGEAVTLVFRTSVKHLRACLTIAAPYAVLVGLFNAATKITLRVGPSAVTVSEVVSFGVAVLAAITVFIGLTVLAFPLTVGGLSLISSADVYGDRIDVRGIVRQVTDHAFDTIGTFLLVVLILAAAPIAIGILAALVATIGSALTAFAVLIFALVVLLVPQIYIAVRLSLAVPAVMREGLKPRAALRRSWELVHGARWAWVLGLGFVVAACIAIGFVLLGFLMGAGHPSGVLAFVLDFVGGAVLGALATVLTGVATGIAYASLAPEGTHVAAQVGAHEVLADELPPVHAPPVEARPVETPVEPTQVERPEFPPSP